MTDEKPTPKPRDPKKTDHKEKQQAKPANEKEIGGYEANGLPEPTRYGDWEVKGRCSDF